MHELIAWSGFVGAWLLVAGPFFQAVIELSEEEFSRAAIEDVSATVPEPAPISPWWWLLPPVGYLKQARRRRDHGAAVLRQMTPAQREQMVRYTNKATGWFFVAGGAFFIAVKETWELHEVYDWPVAVFWVLVVVMPLACALNTALRMRRTRGFLAFEGAPPR